MNEEYIIEECIFSITANISGAKGSFNLIPIDKKAESIIDFLNDEEKAVEWLINDSDFRTLVFKNLFEDASNVKSFTGLKEPFIFKQQKPGDIDLLLVNPLHLEKSIAIECKIVKAKSLEKGEAKINKVEKIKKGIIQANKYLTVGFSQSYLMIIVLDDGRNSKIPNVLLRSAEYENLKRMYNFPFLKSLKKEVGLIYIHLNQISSSIESARRIGCNIERRASQIKQKKSITNSIQNLLQ